MNHCLCLIIFVVLLIVIFVVLYVHWRELQKIRDIPLNDAIKRVKYVINTSFWITSLLSAAVFVIFFLAITPFDCCSLNICGAWVVFIFSFLLGLFITWIVENFYYKPLLEPVLIKLQKEKEKSSKKSSKSKSSKSSSSSDCSSSSSSSCSCSCCDSSCSSSLFSSSYLSKDTSNSRSDSKCNKCKCDCGYECKSEKCVESKCCYSSDCSCCCSCSDSSSSSGSCSTSSSNSSSNKYVHKTDCDDSHGKNKKKYSSDCSSKRSSYYTSDF